MDATSHFHIFLERLSIFAEEVKLVLIEKIMYIKYAQHYATNYELSLKNVSLCGLSLVIFYLFLTTIFTKPEKKLEKDLRQCYKELVDLIIRTDSNPILLRLAWSDAVTYDSAIMEWPYCGGVNGSIRSDYELDLPTNAGLSKAISLLTILKKKYKTISWSDLIQMAGSIAVRVANGPLIELKYGRIDAPLNVLTEFQAQTKPNNTQKGPTINQQKNNSNNRLNSNLKSTTNSEKVPKRSFVLSLYNRSQTSTVLPCPFAPFPDGAPSADIHIRNIFYRLGFNNKETVALCGAHTIGRAFKDRSGWCNNLSGDQGATPFTKPTSTAKANGKKGIGMSGGCSWTKNWLHFDNSYFKRLTEEGNLIDENDDVKAPNNPTDLLWLPTDQALFDCPEYRPHFLRYANSLSDFHRDYSLAHRKMSELGSKFKYHIQFPTQFYDSIDFHGMDNRK
eukprot:gene9413-12678_t